MRWRVETNQESKPIGRGAGHEEQRREVGTRAFDFHLFDSAEDALVVGTHLAFLRRQG